MHLSQHMIGAGWNAADEDMDYIGELQPMGDIQLGEPVGADHGFSEGKTIVRLDELTTQSGKNKQVFVMNMTFPQYEYIRSTYLGGGYSGKVTVRTRWRGKSWANYNCYLRIQSEGMGKIWAGFKDVEWTYSDLRAIV